MIETELVNKLRGISANVYPCAAPRDYQTPAIIYTRIGMDADRELTDDDQDEGWVDFQIDTYSPRILEAKTIGRTITTLLKAWDDDLVGAVQWTNELHSVDDTTEVSLYRVMIQMRFYAREL